MLFFVRNVLAFWICSGVKITKWKRSNHHALMLRDARRSTQKYNSTTSPGGWGFYFLLKSVPPGGKSTIPGASLSSEIELPPRGETPFSWYQPEKMGGEGTTFWGRGIPARTVLYICPTSVGLNGYPVPSLLYRAFGIFIVEMGSCWLLQIVGENVETGIDRALFEHVERGILCCFSLLVECGNAVGISCTAQQHRFVTALALMISQKNQESSSAWSIHPVFFQASAAYPTDQRRESWDSQPRIPGSHPPMGLLLSVLTEVAMIPLTWPHDAASSEGAGASFICVSL